MDDSVTVTLSRDEALVLFEFFTRFSETDQFRLRDNAEFIAFSRLSAQLDLSITEPFRSNYQELLKEARGRLAEGYEGLAPGVEP